MIRTPITYYGGKQMMAKQIVALMPEHRIYCEPYFGGGAVFFRKPKSYLEVINDINDQLITFYSVLQNDYVNLQSIISKTLHSEKLHKIAKDIYYKRNIESSDLEIAWAVWYVTNTSFGGNIHGGFKWDNGNAGSHSGIYLRRKREEISIDLYNRIKEVQISCRNAIRVIEDRDTHKTFFYLDPPYPGANQGHYYGFSMIEFIELLEKLTKIKGKFILSNYWSQSLKYYCLKNNWKVLTFTSKMKVANLGSRQKKGKQKLKEKTEILVMNFIPEDVSQLKFDF